MSDELVERVAREAKRVRVAILLSRFSDLLPASLGRFPYASCGHACDLLNLHFRDVALPLWPSACGRKTTRGGIATHAWLARDGSIVDITADQFRSWKGPAVYVGELTEWHRKWGGTTVHEPRAEYLDAMITTPPWAPIVARFREKMAQVPADV